MLTGRSVVLVVNPSAGRGLAARLLPELIARIKAAGADLEVVVAQGFDHARTSVEQAAASGPDVVAVVGGDGMMHLGVNACARVDPDGPERPTLALLPAGTGNDLCRGLGIDVTDTLGAVQLMISGTRRPIDVTRCEGAEGRHLVGSVVAAGFDALVNRRANAMSWPRGSSRYTLAALRELATFAPLSYRLVLDGEARELDAMFVAVGNTSTYGGGMQICLGADPLDGELDVTIIHPVGRATLLQLLPQMNSGRFVRHRCVERLRATEIRIEGVTASGERPPTYGDGEPIGSLPLTLSTLPGALAVFLPA